MSYLGYTTTGYVVRMKLSQEGVDDPENLRVAADYGKSLASEWLIHMPTTSDWTGSGNEVSPRETLPLGYCLSSLRRRIEEMNLLYGGTKKNGAYPLAPRWHLTNAI